MKNETSIAGQRRHTKGPRIKPVPTKSPFERYRGIGTPGIGRGRKAVVRCVRNLRGR